MAFRSVCLLHVPSNSTSYGAGLLGSPAAGPMGARGSMGRKFGTRGKSQILPRDKTEKDERRDFALASRLIHQLVGDFPFEISNKWAQLT